MPERSYRPGEKIFFNLTFPSEVTVSGSPELEINIGGTNRSATYSSGSGFRVLSFEYVVAPGENDTNGISVSPTINLNGGTLRYDTDKDCPLAITVPSLSTVLVDSIAPSIVTVTGPAAGSYGAGQALNFLVTFSERVTVTGLPRLSLIVGSTTKYANYNAGSGTSVLSFTFPVGTGDLDTDGIEMTSPLELNGGTIRDAAAYNSTLNFTGPDLSAVRIPGTITSILSITLPSPVPAGGFDSGSAVNFVVNFSGAVTQTGGPSRLKLNVGGTTRFADYVSGSGTASHTYRYVVAASDEDLNGLQIESPLEANGATLSTPSGPAPILTFTPPATTALVVDAVAPVLTANTKPLAGTYRAGMTLDFDVTFHEPVTIAGTPRISLGIGSSTRFANYLSGSGTSIIRFRHTLASPDTDTDGISVSASLDLNGGSIRDPRGHDAGTTLVATDTSTVFVDTQGPTIISVTPPTDGTYGLSQALNFSVSMSEAVTVTGSPRIALDIGGNARFATYVSGSGSANHVYRYTVASSDTDLDGISVSSPVSLNSGSLKDAAGNDLTLTFSPPATAGVLVNGAGPFITSVTAPANRTYETGEILMFTVTFSEAVVVTLIPRISLSLDSGAAYATYSSGGGTSVLTFQYTVPAGDFDLNGIGVSSPIDLNGGFIQNLSLSQNADLTFTPPATTGVLIDGLDPVISTVTPPANKTYGISETMDFLVNFSENVTVTGTPTLSLTIGSTVVSAGYVSGSGTKNLLFRYTVLASQTDTDGVTLASPVSGGTIEDAFGDSAGLTFTLPNTASVLVDGIAPTLITVSAPSDKTYRNGETIDFTITTSEAVTVTGSPRLALTVGSSTLYATYHSGSGSTGLTFRYTVGPTHQDLDGIAITSSLDLNSGTIRDAGNNSLSSLSFTPPNVSGIIVDGASPYILSVTPPSAATYKTSDSVNFTVTYSTAVTITGSPRIPITVGSSGLFATYVSGSGTDTLVFRYTVLAGHADSDGITSASPVELNSGTIKSSGGVDALLTFTPPSTNLVLVDGIDIALSSITPPADATYKIGDTLSFTATFNYPATVTGTPRLSLNVGGVTKYATYVSGSGTVTQTYTYTVGAGDSDTDGIALTGTSIDLNGGTIRDAFGDNASLTYTGATYANKKVDGIRPVISSSAVSANKTYITGESIDFTLTYSEASTITGSPRLVLTVGSGTAYANYYAAGSTATAKVFRYTVTAGALDTDGISASNSVDLNSGTIRDTAGNDQSVLTYTVPVLTNVRVDGVGPTITNVTGPASATYGASAALNFNVTFSEAVTVAGGTPTLALTIGGAAKSATYISGSGTATLVFRYTTVAGDSDTNGVDVTSNPVTPGTATIRDASGNSADLTYGGVNFPGVLVDALSPSVSSVTLPANTTYQNGGARPTLAFSVVFNETVTVTGTPRIVLTIGSTTRYANYASGTGSTTLVFNYSVAATDLDLDGIAVANSSNIDLNGGTIRDAYANNATLSLGSLSTSRIFVVFPVMRNWYDFSDTNSVSVAGGVLTAINDKIGTHNLTHNSTGFPYSTTGFNGQSSAYITCNGSTYLFNAASINVKSVLGIYRANAGGYLISSGNFSQPMVNFNGTTTAALGTNGSTYASGAFGAASTTANNVWSANTYRMRAIQWTTGVSMPTGICVFPGQMSEFFMFSSNPTAAELTAIQTFMTAKHNLSFP